MEPESFPKIRRAQERGHANFGWLDSYHSFSFGDYFDPAHMGFGSLRVINEDRVAGAGGFPTHGHRDMEIVSFVITGALEHKDTLGNSTVIKPGEVQRMTAGTGIRHSEYNASKSETAHFLQIWIVPREMNLKPGYEQKNFSDAFRSKPLTLVASPKGDGNAVKIHQDAKIFVGNLNAENTNTLSWQIPPKRKIWVQMITGELEISISNGAAQSISAGDGWAWDGATLENQGSLELKMAGKVAENQFLLFDLSNG